MATLTDRIMEDSGYITLNPDWVTYTLTPTAAYAVGLFTLGEQIEREQALVGSTQAQESVKLAELAAVAGFTVDIDPRHPGRATLRTGDLVKLLAAYREITVSAFAH